MVTTWVLHHLLQKKNHKISWPNSGELLRWSLWWVWPSCQVSKEYFIFKYQNCHWDLSLFGLILKMQMSDDNTCPVDILMDTNHNTLHLNSHTYFYTQYWFFKWKTCWVETLSSWNKTSKMLCAGVSATDENQTLLLFGVSWILLNRFFFIFSIHFVSFLWKHCWIKYVLQLFYFHSMQAFSWHSVNSVIVQMDQWQMANKCSSAKTGSWKYKFVCTYWNTFVFVRSEYWIINQPYVL